MHSNRYNWANKTQRADEMPNKDGTTNVRVNEDRYDAVTKAKLELYISTGKEIRQAELIGFLIDDYLEDLKADIKSRAKKNG